MKLRIVLWIWLCLLTYPIGSSSCAKQPSVHQTQIDRNRKKKDQQARKEYEAAVKKHHNNQSKSTRAMMKKSRREARHLTPGRK